MEDITYNSDEDVSFKSKKIVRKSHLVMSSDDEELVKETFSHESKVAEVNENSEFVDDANLANNLDENSSKIKKYSRVKQSNFSDSESGGEISDDDTSLKSKKESDIEDNIISFEKDEFRILPDAKIVSDKLKEDRFQDDIYDAEGSSEEDVKENSPNILNETSDTSPSLKKKAKSVKTKTAKRKKETVSEIDEIHKEAQRRVRESRVSLPYHIPRQRSLQDFLSRRKAVPIVPLKSTSENLSLVWKHLEEREKTAESFYNSETDESDQEETKAKCCDNEKSKPVENASQSSEVTETVESTWKVNINESSCNSTTKDIHSENNETNDSVPNLNIDENALSSSLFEKKHFSTVCSAEVNTNGEAKTEVTSKNNHENSKVLKISDSDLINIDLRISDSSCSVMNDDKIPSSSELSKQGNDSVIKSNLQLHNKEILKANGNNLVKDILIDEQFTPEALKKSLFETLDKEDEIISTKNNNLENDIDPSCSKHSESIINSTTVIADSNNILEKVPKLSCGPGDEIDLDQPIGSVNKLLKRFIKHSKLKTTKPKEKKTVKLSVISVETNGGSEVTSVTEEELAISSEETKPGQKLCALKQSLKKSIEVTRSQLLAKRIEQYKIYEQEFYEETGGCDPKQMSDDEDEEFENEMFGDKTDANSDDELKNKSSDNEKSDLEGDDDDDEGDGEDDVMDDEEIIDKDEDENVKRKKNDLLDEEAEESDDEKDISESESGSEEDSDSDDTSRSKDDKPSLDTSMSHSKKLNLSSLGLDQGFEENSDLIGLCSGKFQTQPVSLTQLEENSSQSYNSSVKMNENDFSQEMFSQKSVKATNILDSDDEDDDDSTVVETQNNVSKIIKRLQFSDDEEEEDDVNKAVEDDGKESDTDEENIEDAVDTKDNDDDNFINNDNDDDDDTNEEVNDVPKDIHYDSEEEIVEGGKFLDVEAELSGSEWGSEDEDERGLSDFEADEADLEKISQSKLQKELGRIHMQELIAEDKREIRLLQELLLEDGDLHSDGPKRQRLFRWSNQGGDNVAERLALSDEEAAGREEEEEEEHLWRKQRQEREEFLSSSRKEEELEGTLDESINLPVNEKKLLKHQQHSGPKLSSHLLSSPDPKQPFKLLTNRGSFLGRGEKVLSKLASLAAPTDQQQQRVRRNMVFSAVSPPRNDLEDNNHVESEKRKAEEPLAGIPKKLKVNKNYNKGIRSLGLLQKLRNIDKAS